MLYIVIQDRVAIVFVSVLRPEPQGGWEAGTYRLAARMHLLIGQCPTIFPSVSLPSLVEHQTC